MVLFSKWLQGRQEGKAEELSVVPKRHGGRECSPCNRWTVGAAGGTEGTGIKGPETLIQVLAVIFTNSRQTLEILWIVFQTTAVKRVSQ